MTHPVVRGAPSRRRVRPGPDGATRPSCADPSRRHRDTRAAAPARSPRPAAASPSTMSGSCDQGSSDCARPRDRAPRSSPSARRPRAREESLVADEAPHRKHAQRRREPEEGQPREPGRRSRREPRSDASRPADPARSAVIVTPTISQCQSKPTAASPGDECAECRRRQTVAGAHGSRLQPARASAPPSSARPTMPSSANVSMYSECRRARSGDSGDARTRRTRTFPHRSRRAGAPHLTPTRPGTVRSGRFPRR